MSRAHAPRPARPAQAERGRRRRVRARAPGEPRSVAYLYLAPALLFYLLFAFGPLLYTAWLSFFRLGRADRRHVGRARQLRPRAQRPAIRGSFVHSLVVLVLFFSVLPCALGLGIASVIAHAQIRGAGVFRAVLFLPQTIATVVVAIAWVWVYGQRGPINETLRLVGLGGIARSWLGDFQFALPALGLVGTWVMFGLCMVLFLAGIQKIPHTLYEAARVDGAGRVREFFAVTLPGLRGELAVALTLTTIIALRTFDLIYVATSGRPGVRHDRAGGARLPERVLQRAGRARGGGRRRADRDHLRRRLRDHAHRRPGPDAMTAGRREQLLSYAVLAIFAVVALYPILTIVLLAFHRRSRPRDRLLDPGLADLRHVPAGVGGGRLQPGLVNSFIVAATVAIVTAVFSHARRLRVRRRCASAAPTRSSTCC